MEWFLTYLYNSGLSDVISDVADLLYTILISIQLFIYIRFDKKIKTAFDRIWSKYVYNEMNTFDQVKSVSKKVFIQH